MGKHRRGCFSEGEAVNGHISHCTFFVPMLPCCATHPMGGGCTEGSHLSQKECSRKEEKRGGTHMHKMSNSINSPQMVFPVHFTHWIIPPVVHPIPPGAAAQGCLHPARLLHLRRHLANAVYGRVAPEAPDRPFDPFISISRPMKTCRFIQRS